ncbi:MAG: 50S ribosomal protein L10 [Nitrospirae bacterium]|nr:50S ribosomal protein L10 [Nitrospirota bacterium]
MERGYKLKKVEKEQVIRELKNEFDRAKAVVFTDYRGMSVAELSELRNILRDGKAEYKIVKNTLAKIASEGTPVFSAKDSFRGPVGIAISYDDPVFPVKKILEYSKKNDKLKVNAGVIEGSICSSADLKAVAETPPRKVLLSMLAGGFQAPLNKMAYALNATLSRFINVLEAIKTKKG